MKKGLSNTTKQIAQTVIRINFSSSEDVAELTGKTLGALILKKLKNNKSVLLMLSGGSAIKVTEDLLDLFKNKNINYARFLTISVVDERVVSGENNNYTSLRKTDFGQWSKNQKIKWVNTKVPQVAKVGAVDELASKFEKQLKEWRHLNSDGVIIALLGVGSDGHTSGILPFKNNSALNLDNKKWVVGYDLNNYYPKEDKLNSHQYRATTTARFLIDEVGCAFVYMVGDSKKKALEKIVSAKGNILETPARLLRRRNKKTEIFTDQFIDV